IPRDRPDMEQSRARVLPAPGGSSCGQPDRAGSMCCGNDAVIGGRSTYPDPVVVQWIVGRHIPAFRESIHPGSEPYECTAHIPYAFPAAPPRACSYDDG